MNLVRIPHIAHGLKRPTSGQSRDAPPPLCHQQNNPARSNCTNGRKDGRNGTGSNKRRRIPAIEELPVRNVILSELVDESIARFLGKRRNVPTTYPDIYKAS
jgi:hypothetical protein